MTDAEAKLERGKALTALVAENTESALFQLALALFPNGLPAWAGLIWPREGGTDPPTGQARAGDADTELPTPDTRYRTFVEQIPAVTFMADLAAGTNEIYVSPHIETMLGFTQAEWLQDPLLWFRQLHPADRHVWLEEFARGCRSGGPFRAECRFLSRDGRVVWVRGEARLVKDAAGRPLFLQGVAFDITESKDAQEVRISQAVRTTEERYREVVQAIGAILWEGDPRLRRFTFVSPQAEQILGFPAPRWLEEPDFWLNRVHAEDQERVSGEWQAAIAAGDSRDMDFRMTTAAGDTVWLHNKIHVLRDEAGRPRSLLGLMLDVTERRRTEEERAQLLRREQEARQEAEALNRVGRQLGAELDLGRLVQAVTDIATEVTGASFGAFFYNVTDERGESFMLYALSGAPRSAFAGFPMPRNTPLFEPTFRGERIVRLDDVHADPRYATLPPHFGMPEGHLPVRSYLAVPVALRWGEVLGGLFFGHPEPGRFTERHERLLAGLAAQAAIAVENARLYRAADDARRTAERANRAKDEFLAILSHELRTPLTAILGWARMLRTGRVDAATAERAIAVIDRNASTQAQIIEDLLDVSRIIAGQFQLDFRAVDRLGPLITAVVDSFRPAAEAKTLSLTVAIDPMAGPIAGDSRRLQQVIWNLLSNAIKFTPPGGRVEISCARVDGFVELRVTDSGKGVAPHFLPRLFDRFSQADSSSTRVHGGLGLGLAIVRHMVELHGGTVKADSPGEGQGASFTVCLPLAGVQSPDGAVFMRYSGIPRPQVAGDALRGRHVMIIDDDRDTCALLATILETHHAAVASATGAEEAMALLEHWVPDIVVCDIGLPGQDGYQLIGRIQAREAQRGRTVPALALTAYASIEDRDRALAAGFNLHITKPVDPAAFIEAVARLGGQPDA